MLRCTLDNLMKVKVRPVESYVVRIYRRHVAEPDRIVGLVEHPEQGTVERFNGVSELIRILLAPIRAAESAAAPEEKDRAQIIAMRSD